MFKRKSVIILKLKATSSILVLTCINIIRTISALVIIFILSCKRHLKTIKFLLTIEFIYYIILNFIFYQRNLKSLSELKVAYCNKIIALLKKYSYNNKSFYSLSKYVYNTI